MIGQKLIFLMRKNAWLIFIIIGIAASFYICSKLYEENISQMKDSLSDKNDQSREIVSKKMRSIYGYSAEIASFIDGISINGETLPDRLNEFLVHNDLGGRLEGILSIYIIDKNHMDMVYGIPGKLCKKIDDLLNNDQSNRRSELRYFYISYQSRKPMAYVLIPLDVHGRYLMTIWDPKKIFKLPEERNGMKSEVGFVHQGRYFSFDNHQLAYSDAYKWIFSDKKFGHANIRVFSGENKNDFENFSLLFPRNTLAGGILLTMVFGLFIRERSGHAIRVEKEVQSRTAELISEKERVSLSEAAYKTLFEQAPISLWDEDFSDLKAYLDGMMLEDGESLESFLDQHRDIARHCATLVKINGMNLEALDLHRANLDRLDPTMDGFFTEDAYRDVIRGIASMHGGQMDVRIDTRIINHDGEVLDVVANLSVVRGHEASWGRVIVAVNNITDLKRMYELLLEESRLIQRIVLSDDDAHEILIDAANMSGLQSSGYDLHIYIISHDRTYLQSVVTSHAGIAPYLRLDRIHFAEHSWPGMHASISAYMKSRWAGQWTAEPICSRDEAISGCVIAISRKEIPPSDLDSAAIKNVASIAGVAIEYRKVQYSYIAASNCDALTGLYNQSYFQNNFERLAYGRHRVSLVRIELNNVNHIYDIYGYFVGDSLVKEASTRLYDYVQDDDRIFRLSEDQFAVVLFDEDESSLVSGARVMSRILRSPYDVNGMKFHVLVYAGLASMQDGHASSLDLIQNAGLALAKAKNINKEVEVYEVGMKRDAYYSMRLEHDLVSAIEDGRLLVHYQTQHDIQSRRIVGLEALIRWDHEILGIIYPNDFIPLAERQGLIDDITCLMIKEVCRQSIQWEGEGIRPARISFNISAIQLSDISLGDLIIDQVRQSGAHPSWFDIEITEGATMQDHEAAMKIMNTLVDSGFSISIDDFGTGYSSLAYLKQLPAHAIKIDQAFVRNLPDDFDLAVIHSAVYMAHMLDKKVVAEGVENPEQLQQLLNEGCDYVQGYYFSRPVHALEVSRMLANQDA